MNMTQVWQLAAAMSTVFLIMFTLALRWSREMGEKLNVKIDGIRDELKTEIKVNEAKIDGVRTELKSEIRVTEAKIDGLRNELVGILQPMGKTLERLDQDFRDHLKAHSGGG